MDDVEAQYREVLHTLLGIGLVLAAPAVCRGPGLIVRSIVVPLSPARSRPLQHRQGRGICGYVCRSQGVTS